MSGAEGRFSRENLAHEGYARELAAFKDVLANAEVVGWPKCDRELAELERLIRKFPTDARRILAATDGPDAAAAP